MERNLCIVAALALCLLSHIVVGAKLNAASQESQLRREEVSSFLKKSRSFEEENTLSRLVLHPTSLESFGADGLLYLQSSVLSLFGNQTESAKVKADEEVAAVPAERQQMYFRPVSVTLKCVMMLTIASLLIYTAVSIARNYDELSAEFVPSAATQALTIASRVGTFAPMMCMLFVSCRMYVLATTKGLGEPPAWVKNCMYTTVAGFAIQLTFVMLLPAFTKTAAKDEASYDMTGGKADEVKDKQTKADAKREEELQARRDAAKERSASSFGTEASEDNEDEEDVLPVAEATGGSSDVHPVLTKVEFEEQSASLKSVFWIMQFVSIFLIYGGVVGVIVGIVTFPAGATKVSAAVQCTVLLSGLYFAVCILLWIARASPGSENEQGQRSALTDAALSMSNTTRKAPMFAVLFLASRMRALNLDPPLGMPPFWMQCCFYGITGLLYVETIVAAIIGFSGKCEKDYYGYYVFRAAKSMIFLQNFCGLVTYAMLYPVIIGVITMKFADGSPAPLSTTLTCVITLECIYFLIMTWQSLTFIAEAAFDAKIAEGFPINRRASLGAGISMNLAPILCVLFVATRMRALQITQQQGAPPGWAQDCMNIAVFACCVQALCCLLLPIFLQTEVDEDGNPDYSNSPMVAAYSLAVLKYVMLIALHASVIGICVSVYVMTPETAHSGNRLIEDRKALLQMMAWTMCIFFVALIFSSAKVIGMGIKMAIEACDQTLLGVDITVKNVALNLFQGYVKIHDLVVHQPEDKIVWSRNAEGKIQAEYPMKDNEPEKCVWKEDYIAKIHMILFKMDVWRTIRTLGGEFDIENVAVDGIFANVEKPSLDVKKMDANVQYIINHMEKLGLAPAPEAPGAKKEEPKKEEPKKDPKKEEPKKEEPKKDDKKEDEPFIPKVLLHKIAFGNFGARVSLKNLPAFKVGIGSIKIDDVQHSVFHDKGDLKPGEMVGCIVQAFAKHMLVEVTHEIPKAIARAAKERAQHTKEAVVAGVKNAGHWVGSKVHNMFHRSEAGEEADKDK